MCLTDAGFHYKQAFHFRVTRARVHFQKRLRTKSVSRPISRREVLANVLLAGTGALLTTSAKSARAEVIIAGKPVAIGIAVVSLRTVRITLLPIEDAKLKPIQYDGSLVQQAWASPRSQFRSVSQTESVKLEELLLRIVRSPLSITLEERRHVVQTLSIDQEIGAWSSELGTG